MKRELLNAKQEIQRTLAEKVIPFWLERSVDEQYGGYLTSFDENGRFDGNGVKYMVTQSRMLWGFSYLAPFARPEDRPAMKAAADQGFAFFKKYFFDPEHGGVYWMLDRDGSVADPAKLVYGEGFAIYALAQYAISYQNEEALALAESVFDCLQKYCADTRFGGYFENVERDWSLSPAGEYAGDRKSLDIHMHLLEAFTTLYQASGKEIHRRKLHEVLDVIIDHMVDKEHGYGYNQFTIDFRRIPAIAIKRTWNAEREANETVAEPADTTSYGHNIELTWLADLALQKIGCERAQYDALFARILQHAMKHGVDWQRGGVYRDGVGCEEALVLDKEWWQNFEAMTGLLNGWRMFGEERLAEAFLNVWGFVRDKFMNMELGESRQMLSADGTPLVPNLGNPWKGIYHTGRALAVCLENFAKIEEAEK
ncbi:MAG: AGE family epimerase/isomerase [Eubacteriales bacterium]|nr:AGE family epimerase/isomerase [Eubacteriales bacterium]